MRQYLKLIATTVFLIFQLASISQNTKENFVGKWIAPKGAVIIVSIKDDAFIGKTEKENAIVLTDVKFSNGKWQAVVLNPKENIKAKCELISYPTKLKIIARKGIFHKTIYWRKQ